MRELIPSPKQFILSVIMFFAIIIALWFGDVLVNFVADNSTISAAVIFVLFFGYFLYRFIKAGAKVVEMNNEEDIIYENLNG